LAAHTLLTTKTIANVRASGMESVDGSRRNVCCSGGDRIQQGKSAQMIRFPRRAWLVGLGIATGLALAAGGSARADDRLSNPNFAATAGFKICENQTYALCAIAGCFVFNEVSYCRCDVKVGKSISLPFQFDGARMSAPSMPRAPPTVTW
jgi:hypothetical protein